MSDDLGTRKITQKLQPKKTTTLTGLLQEGKTLAQRYMIMEPLGSGGMGSVFKARDLRFPNVTKLVAVKVLLNQTPDMNLRQIIARTFEREANILATLSHHAIPKIYDFFSEEDRSYLVQEHIDGSDLEAIMNQTTDFIPYQKTVEWAIELCDVLQYLHNYKPQPIVFRDMKPSNVMIDHHSRVRLIDFGIARGFEADQKGTVIGTEGYSPPEQYRGVASPVGDIYALGATMHHLLTRRDPRLEPPFSFGDRPIRQSNPDVPEELELIVNRALAYEAAERYPNAKIMQDVLETFYRGTAKDSTSMATVNLKAADRRPAPPPPKTTGFIPGADTDFFEGGVLPVWSFACEDEIRSAPFVAGNAIFVAAYDNNVYALNAETGQFIWKFAAEGAFAASPIVSKEFLYIGAEDGTIYALRAESGEVIWTYETDGPVRCTATAVGGYVFVGSDDGNMYALNTDNGRLLWSFQAQKAIRSRPVVSEQDGLLFFGCEGVEFYAVDFSGSKKWVFKGKRGFTASPAFSDGTIYIGNLDSQMYALEMDNGWPLWRHRANKAIVSSAVVDEKQRVYFGSADKYVYALDGHSGKVIWRYQTEGQVASSPAIAEGRLYIGSADGHLYSIDIKTGKLAWKFKAGGPVISSPTVSGETVYVGSLDGSIYALVL